MTDAGSPCKAHASHPQCRCAACIHSGATDLHNTLSDAARRAGHQHDAALRAAGGAAAAAAARLCRGSVAKQRQDDVLLLLRMWAYCMLRFRQSGCAVTQLHDVMCALRI